jgi:membrane-bound serine protease (ClpP class)
MAWTIGLAILLYVVCAGLLVAEVFVPSGGLLTVTALTCLGAGIYIFFEESVAMGWVGVAVAVLLIPSVLIASYRIFPKTRFGRAVTLEPPRGTQGDAVPDARDLAELQGKTGRVLKPLRPVGICEISGHKVECVAQNGYVDIGTEVTVIRIEGTQVTVRARVET